MISIIEKSQCSGCSACYSTCPINCIQMISDAEGFYYPVVNTEKCIECRKCEKVCPYLNDLTLEAATRKVFVCQNRSLPIRQDSTSGGVFSALSQYVIDRNGIVFGAAFDKQFCINHKGGRSLDSLANFRGSKYVQSWMGDTFRDVRAELEKDQWVLFSGTPCQVAGLNAYLGKKYEKLVLMDIVCYSISSPGIWKQFLEYISRQIPISEIERIKFRDKTKYGYEYTQMTFFDRNGEVLYSAGPETNPMLRSFVSNTSTRPSCYSCPFKTIDRVSDFTAWDCYNVFQYDKKMDDNKGTSHLMIHSNKGLEIMKELSKYLAFFEVDSERAVKSEPAMTECAKPSDIRQPFFDLYQSNKNVFDTYFKDTSRVKIERFLRHALSKIGVYKTVKRLLKGN